MARARADDQGGSLVRDQTFGIRACVLRKRYIPAHLPVFDAKRRQKAEAIAFLQKFFALDEATAAESHAIYARLIIDDGKPLAEAIKTVLDQQGKPDLPLDRVVDATVVEEVLRERR